MLPVPVHNMLGLAQRAGRVAAGDAAADLALRRGKAALVLLATDAADATAQSFRAMAEKAGAACLVAGTKDELGGAVGKSPRAVLVITHRDFARGLIAKLQTAGVPAPPRAERAERGWQDDRP